MYQKHVHIQMKTNMKIALEPLCKASLQVSIGPARPSSKPEDHMSLLLAKIGHIMIC